MKGKLSIMLVMSAFAFTPTMTGALTLDFACRDFRPLFALDGEKLERPKAPSCVDMFGKFASEFDFSDCKNEVLEYQNKIRNYQDCLVSESRAANEAVNEAVDKFNTRARSP
ncbi:hypothetical protein [Labrys sp. ZIDIC5]|uniref:hypothetical protein n=1 Tax=Labrys sedimenti TaxID=3106036 RepID=UPI002ACA5F8F|nr:hypothetical protein [Labrys sp. ZIDIC5]MDZ5448635.1 hypothetical protein [Labrys sp. ZIDIC5]